MHVEATAAIAANNEAREVEATEPNDDFQAKLDAAGERASAVEKVGEFVDDLQADEARLDGAMRRMLHGRELDSVELLRTQSLMYGYSQRIELASKVVESATSGLKQLLNTQV